MNRNTFVAPVKRVKMPDLPIDANVNQSIDVVPSSVQHIEVKTSAVDRAKGFLLASVPLYAGFASATVGVCVVGFGMPLLTLPTLVIFLLAFIAAWVIGYTYTLQTSAEGVSLYEAKEKWAILKEEQRRRWDEWERINNINVE